MFGTQEQENLANWSTPDDIFECVNLQLRIKIVALVHPFPDKE